MELKNQYIQLAPLRQGTTGNSGGDVRHEEPLKPRSWEGAFTCWGNQCWFFSQALNMDGQGRTGTGAPGWLVFMCSIKRSRAAVVSKAPAAFFQESKCYICHPIQILGWGIISCCLRASYIIYILLLPSPKEESRGG